MGCGARRFLQLPRTQSGTQVPARRGLCAARSGIGRQRHGDPNGTLGTLARAAELQRQTPDARLNAQIQLVRGTALQNLQRGAEVGADTVTTMLRRADAALYT